MEGGRREKKKPKILTVKLYDTEEILSEMQNKCRLHASEIVRAGIRLLYREWIIHGRDCDWLIHVVQLYGIPGKKIVLIEEVDDDG